MKKHRIRSIISMILVFAMCLQFSVSATGMSDFNDVPANHWAYSSIAYVVNHGIMNGTGDTTFDPDDVASRAMIITTIYRIAGQPSVNNANVQAFPDVPTNTWYSVPIRWAKNIGIIEGHDDGTFRPTTSMPREQIALIMSRYADYLDYNTNGDGANISVFPDFNDTPSGCKPAMRWAIKKGMLVGREDGKLYPNAAATRAELATCLYRFCTNDAPVTGVTINPASKTVSVGWHGYIPATISPYNAGNNAVYWTSSNPTVATVNTDGYIYVNHIGTAVITVRTDDGNYTDSCTINVMGPTMFKNLIASNTISPTDVDQTDDGLFVMTKPLSYLFTQKGITALPQDVSGVETLSVTDYYDDWYLFAVKTTTATKYGLYKMREQESDDYDNNDPGVTISFVALSETAFTTALTSPTLANKYNLLLNLKEVTGPGSYDYDETIAAYFQSTDSDGPYLIAEKYISFLAGLSTNGILAMPNKYIDMLEEIDNITEWLQNPFLGNDARLELINAKNKLQRIPNALATINTAAGHTIYNSSTHTLTISNGNNLTIHEKHAILASFAANVNLNSFAAEVEFHADALEDWKANFPEWYASALRADMAIGEGGTSGYTQEYYNLNSTIVQAQITAHGNR